MSRSSSYPFCYQVYVTSYSNIIFGRKSFCPTLQCNETVVTRLQPTRICAILYSRALWLSSCHKAMDSKQNARCVYMYIGVPFILIVVIWMLCSLPTVFYVLAQFKVSESDGLFVFGHTVTVFRMSKLFY